MTNFTETFRPLRPAPFDRTKVFRAMPKLNIFNGKPCKPGDTIDTTLLTTRRLRQLYEQRFVSMHDIEEEDDKARPLFEQMPTPAVVSWLKSRKKVPRRGALRESIVKLADAVWRKENGITT